MNKQQLLQEINAMNALTVTGIPNAGDHLICAQEKGYKFVEVVDWSSSAGDWVFTVSMDEIEWHPMYQTNNYPQSGFTVVIDENERFLGTNEEAIMYYSGYCPSCGTYLDDYDFCQICGDLYEEIA